MRTSPVLNTIGAFAEGKSVWWRFRFFFKKKEKEREKKKKKGGCTDIRTHSHTNGAQHVRLIARKLCIKTWSIIKRGKLGDYFQE